MRPGRCAEDGGSGTVGNGGSSGEAKAGRGGEELRNAPMGEGRDNPGLIGAQ